MTHRYMQVYNWSKVWAITWPLYTLVMVAEKQATSLTQDISKTQKENLHAFLTILCNKS